jgi:hypothetical protein
MCFARSVGSFIRNYVILQDPNRNHIKVNVERKNSKIYFTAGWSRLRDFYSITVGGWVTVLYVSPLLFYIRVRRITGLEVIYPEKNPPYRLVLNHECCHSYVHGPVPFYLAPSTFYHKLEKSLTSSDVTSGVLVRIYRQFSLNFICSLQLLTS